MKVLITGSSGFVGQNLLPYLKARNFEIKNVKRSLKSDLDISYENLSKDWVNTNEIKSFIHLAGKAHDLKNTSDPEEYFKVNTNLTIQLYDIFLKSDAKVFINMSSVKAVADRLDIALSEIHNPNPKTTYGQSKLNAENYILNNLPEKGKQVYILRPCIIHGPGNKGNLNLLYKIVSKGLPWPLGDFDNKRSFCNIENLCFIINELIERNDIPSGIYNIADDEPISTNGLIELMAKALNRKPRIYKIPKSVIKLTAKSGDLLRLPLNSVRLKKLTESYVVSNEKLVKAIGKPMPVSVRDGLYSTFLSFQTSIHS